MHIFTIIALAVLGWIFMIMLGHMVTHLMARTAPHKIKEKNCL
jgi:hypothetical protein